MKPFGGSGPTATPVFTSALDGSEWSVSLLIEFTLGIISRYKMDRTPGGSLRLSERSGLEKSLFPLAGIELQPYNP
jgi:hypothetical protein